MSQNILEIIVKKKRKEVEERKKETPLSSLSQNIKKSDVSFFDALQGKNRVHLIAEIKYASPSRGIMIQDNEGTPLINSLLLEDTQKKEKLYFLKNTKKEVQTVPSEKYKIHLLQTIQLYNSYASAISVLTDECFFGGSFSNLRTARENSYLPLLCKDFIIDEYQVYEARKHGANAILLIVAILSEGELRQLYAVAQSLNMDVLFEVHDKQELDKILPLQPRIIGVNNRNLKDFSIDHDLTKKLSPYIPKNSILVAESGISKWKEVENIQGLADAMLIGTSIMQADAPKEKIQELTSLPEIKICGITNTEDAIEAIRCGASYIGIIFAPSPRKVDIKTAQEILQTIKAQYPTIKVGGVFVNEEKVWEIANELQLDFVQLHGDESEDNIKKGRNLYLGEIWKAITIRNDALQIANEELEKISVLCDKILFDTASQEHRGGSGKTFNWEILEGVQFSDYNSQLILAGGVNSKNIQEARNYASVLDIGSGVEKEKGKKDKEKLKKLFWNLKR